MPLTSYLQAVQPYQLVQLNSRNVSSYQELTYSRYRHLLLSLAFDSSVVAIGAEVDGVPTGLALAQLQQAASASTGGQTGQILSLFVLPSQRQSSLGTALLARLEDELRQRGCTEAELIYTTNAHAIALKRILDRQFWTPLQITGLVGYASTDRVKQAQSSHFIQQLNRLLAKLPPDYEIFPWQTLTSQERQLIEQQMQSDQQMQQSNPFLEESQIEPLNSLGLRHRGRVVGWLITHRITPNTIGYIQMYIDLRSQPLSHSLLLLAKAIQLQVDQAPGTRATFRVDIDNTPMIRFVHRRLKPYLDEVRTAWKATKILA